MIKNSLFLILLLLQFTLAFSQGPDLSPVSKLSLLTVGTGEDLAAKFGHSAIRIQDPTLGIDQVYGYGTYNFEDPNFYLNFVRGKLDYTISRYPYIYFERSYIAEQRWIKEQMLDVNLEQKKEIISFLETNLLPQNRFYKYDFLFENCATKIPQVFEESLGSALQFDYSYLENRYTFRQLIHQNLEVNSWSNFGIDLALGSIIDRKATPYEHLFLPLYVYEQMKHTSLNGKPIVQSESVLLDIPPRKDQTLFFLTPVFWLGLFMFFVLFITYKDFTKNSRTRWLDVLLASVTGLAGLLILFLWFLTDHNATKMNFNILWAFAPNIIIAFYLSKKQLALWVRTYILLLFVLLILVVILWLLKIQVFSILMVFILIALAIRYLFLVYHFRKTL
ncbi:DUF4105 domain-containing protein [Maribacter aestuarii]|uniref:lipoprotein N-acyltransferase Lnb domain-containing protein n=1 Tax=Maribacter aestuarii TaxID=1130723 RepID=UPI0025A6252C|nr:DUF4105 domain-containing protein [Maribacter aestuarii]